MWVANLRVISALREKRARVAGYVARLERQLDQYRADLSHIDSVLRLFELGRDLDEIRPKRTYVKRTRYFARNELSRLVPEALRDAGSEKLSTDEIASLVIAAKGFDVTDIRAPRGDLRPSANTPTGV
jgi:hypothetical protein